jgi:hypothetical protein
MKSSALLLMHANMAISLKMLNITLRVNGSLLSKAESLNLKM